MNRFLMAGALALATLTSTARAVDVIDFRPGSYTFFISGADYDFYRFPPRYGVAVHGGIANGYATGDAFSISILVPGQQYSLASFDVRGTGDLTFRNFDGQYSPVSTYTLSSNWQTISFNPEVGGFFFELKSSSAFDLDNVTFGAPTGIPGGGIIPEPAQWALMLAGFGAIGGMARRRTKVSRSPVAR